MTPGTKTVDSTALRSRFAARLSALYGTEVPAYTTLVEVSQEVNDRVLRRETETHARAARGANGSAASSG